MIERFNTKDLGLVLGMEIVKTQQGFLLKQTEYIDQLVERFLLKKGHTVFTPMAESCKPMRPRQPYGSAINCKDIPYRQLVGSLQYLVRCSRPDLANAVRTLSKFLDCSASEHFELAQRVLRYAKNYCLKLQCPTTPTRQPVQLIGYADADFGNDQERRRSVSGYVVMVCGSVFAYMSKLQPTAVDDTCSAELIKHRDAVLYCDNKSTIQVLTQESSHHIVKHLDLKRYLIMNYIQANYFRLLYCPSSEMVADVMTKPLGNVKFA
ncbi:TPA: hypothetical protein N0F65_003740 [Lagenidium giganteum]|uniref:Reverse transcriptase Ty1/copia-type domain-containing protein n=1 Tax=Lagenidium giganteum TaxID=4803 RepID=A0AAV2Z3U9_9STRA|nr:TPA: hypothetical protein N0F65_003740 [Lagenidium giganteum]